MKHALSIGIHSCGSTSLMRTLKIKKILSDWEIDTIDTDIPTKQACRISQSIGFRYKCGPLISKVNKYVLDNLKDLHYDLIWVDKAIYLTKETTQVLRDHTDKIVHFTPDPAFTFHKSKLFYKSMPLYDYVITTKSYEMNDYIRVMGSVDKVLYVTQGYDKDLHRPVIPWEQKDGVAFIGHYESDRVKPLEALLHAGVDVTLAGNKWNDFAKKHQSRKLHYLGNGVYGEDYVRTLSRCLFAWGSVSKWIPEKHTTRTFEIPAVKTALLTERNEELEGFFQDDEVIFYNSTQDMVSKVIYYCQHKKELRGIIEKGYEKVQSGKFDYESILRNLLKTILDEKNMNRGIDLK